MQADAGRIGIGWFRSLAPRCTGTIWWQLNDCWPVISWAAVDGDGRLKPLWYALREVYRPRLLTIQPGDAGLEVVALNDTDDPWQGPLTLRLLDVNGTGHRRVGQELDVAPRGVSRVPVPASWGAAGPDRVVLAEFPGSERAWWWIAPPKDVPLAAPDAAIEVHPGPHVTEVVVTGNALVRDAMLLVDRVAPDAEADTALVTLLPGETWTVRVTGQVPEPEALAGTLVSVNHLRYAATRPLRDDEQLAAPA